MLLGLPEPLPSLVAKRFAAAKEAGALIFSATHLAVLPAAGVHYQLRYCPALSKKPQSVKQEKGQEKGPKIDPFDNPARELLVAEIPSPADDQDASSGHILVLNKFPVIPRHFILATKRFRNQTDLLEKEDLEATFACIQAWKNQDSHDDEDEAKKRLFAFFNSGDESGASQPHRHLQFLPVEDMREQQDDKDPKWIPLIDRVATADVVTESGLRTLPSLPFRHFALPLPLAPSLETLYEAYLSLYRAAVQVSSSTWDPAEKAEKLAQTAGPAAISYNFAMTESAMMICPRRSETAYLNNKNNNNDDNDTNTGKISLNGTILAGTLMVKQESEWDELRNEPEKINFLLADVGF